MKAKIIAMAIAILSLSTHVTAGVDEIRNNYRNDATVSSNATATNPGYQVLAAPAINWKPQMDISNVSGTPRINLQKAVGNITNTTGVSQSIKDYVAEKASASSLGWKTVYSGSGTRYINVGKGFTFWRATVAYNGITKAISGSIADEVGVSYSKTLSQSCVGGTHTLTITARLYTPAGPTMSWPSSASNWMSNNVQSCGHLAGTATIENFRVLRFEAYM